MEQHFLTAEAKLGALIRAARIRPGDRVLELGSGGGTVAAALKRHAPPCTLTLVELEPHLAGALRAAFPDATVLQEDALDVLARAEADIILSNLPHALTGAMLTRLNRKTFRRAVVAVHERDDVELSAHKAETLSLEPLLTLDEGDFTPPQPFKSKLMLVTRHRA